MKGSPREASWERMAAWVSARLSIGTFFSPSSRTCQGGREGMTDGKANSDVACRLRAAARNCRL